MNAMIAGALGALLLAVPFAAPAAEYTAAEKAACLPDAVRLCASDIPDVAAVTACMKKHRRQVSPGCRAAAAAHVKRARLPKHRLPPRRESHVPVPARRPVVAPAPRAAVPEAPLPIPAAIEPPVEAPPLAVPETEETKPPEAAPPQAEPQQPERTEVMTNATTWTEVLKDWAIWLFAWGCSLYVCWLIARHGGGWVLAKLKSIGGTVVDDAAKIRAVLKTDLAAFEARLGTVESKLGIVPPAVPVPVVPAPAAPTATAVASSGATATAS